MLTFVLRILLNDTDIVKNIFMNEKRERMVDRLPILSITWLVSSGIGVDIRIVNRHTCEQIGYRVFAQSLTLS